MQRIKLILVSLALTLTLCLFGCGKNEIERGKHELTLYVATDTHLFASSLVPETNEKYVKEVLTSDGRLQEYDIDLLTAFADRLNEDKPRFAMLTGDLTYNGERKSHEQIADILSSVSDTKILVIPGNHDIANRHVMGYQNDRPTAAKTVSADEFRDIYRDYGYSGAYSYDSETLSYIYELSENQWALMLDTTLCRYNDALGENNVGGSVEKSTLLWLEENLSYAKENNINVISFTHHNLLIHNELFENMYTLYNAGDVIDLFGRYDVDINFSGHLHIQSIKEKDGIYDIAGGSLLDYGNRYGVLDIYEGAYEYSSKRLPTDIKNFEQYSFETFYNEYYEKKIGSNEKLFGSKAGDITSFEAKANCYYFDGDYENLHSLLESSRDLVKLIDDPYFESITDTVKTNQHCLLIEK